MNAQTRMNRKNTPGPVRPMLSRKVAPATAVIEPRLVQPKNLTNCAAKNTSAIYSPSVLMAWAMASMTSRSVRIVPTRRPYTMPTIVK